MRRKYGFRYTLPLNFWLTFFFIIPTLIIVVFSFLKRGLYGGVIWHFTMEAYRALLYPAFLKVVFNTFYISVMSTILTIMLSIPVAYYIARSPYKHILLLFVIVPFWTNLLIRVFAWITILGNNGFLNHFLIRTGLIHDHFQFLYNSNAVILVTIYTNLPYAILPLFAAIEKFDFSLLEAARDLGASKIQSLWHVFLPNIKPGIITAVIFTFIPALGSYAIPQLVGGRNSMMIGNIIARELTVNRNWPLASSMSVILTVITMIGVLIFVKVNQQKKDDRKRFDKYVLTGGRYG